MCQGRQRHGVWHFSLLIVTAIQGLTPDPYDLASLNALRVLFPALCGSHTLPADDGLPDEVCAPATSEAELDLRANSALSADAVFAVASSDAHALTIHSIALSRGNFGGTTPRTDDLFHSACRFNC